MNSSSLPPLYEGTGKYIYFSFSQEDAGIALRLLEKLAAAKCPVWYDAGRLGTPHGFLSADVETLGRKLYGASVFVCVLSPHYLKDELCARELAYATRHGITVIPVRVDKTDLPESARFYLSSVQIFDITESDFTPDGNPQLLNLVSYCREKTRPPEADWVPAPKSDSGGGSGSYPAMRPSPQGAAAPRPSPKGSPARSAESRRKPGLLKRLFSGRKSKPETKPETEETSRISFSVLSPRVVKPDSHSVIDLHMYTEAQRGVVDRAIRESGGLLRETSKSGFSVRQETSVTARLESEYAVIKDPMETQVWNGSSLHFDFSFYVPAGFTRTEIPFTCYIEYNGIPVTRLNFVTAVSGLVTQDALPAKVTRSNYRKAFISYSRQDEQRMLARVLGIHELAPEMNFWLDRQSMDAGALWREEIRRAIDISDVLLLFWSVPASKSEEVEKEWRYGLQHHGLHFIAPVPLDPPEQCPPPEPLRSLNFTVRAFSRNEITEQLSFYDSKNIRVV